MTLEELFTKYGTDKGIWGYTQAYEHHLGPMQGSATAVLEIGICGFRDIPNNVVGASLFAWRDYFPNAEIYGIDYDPRFIFNDQARIRTVQADAYDPVSLGMGLRAFGDAPRFDFICDDAVHDPLPQITLFRMLWPYLKRGGVYSIEDVCPYKCTNGTLDEMAALLMVCAPDASVTEYTTHKAERLLIVRKEP